MIYKYLYHSGFGCKDPLQKRIALSKLFFKDFESRNSWIARFYEISA